MLEVRRDNDKVVISISTDLANDCEGKNTAIIPFSWSTGQPYVADLLVRYITKILGDRVKAIRAAAYEQGWKDAKAKRTRETWFSYQL